MHAHPPTVSLRRKNARKPSLSWIFVFTLYIIPELSTSAFPVKIFTKIYMPTLERNTKWSVDSWILWYTRMKPSFNWFPLKINLCWQKECPPCPRSLSSRSCQLRQSYPPQRWLSFLSGSSQKYACHHQPQGKLERQILLNIIVGWRETDLQPGCWHASSLHICNLWPLSINIFFP